MTNKPNETAHWKKLPVLTEVVDKAPIKIPVLTEEVSRKTEQLPTQPKEIQPDVSMAQSALISLTAEQCLHFNSSLAS